MMFQTGMPNKKKQKNWIKKRGIERGVIIGLHKLNYNMKATCLSRFEKPFAKVLNLQALFLITYCMVFCFFFYLQLINPVLQPLLWLDFEELHLFQEVLALPRWLLFKLSATCLQLSCRDTPQLLWQECVFSFISIFSKAFGIVLL